MASWARTLAVYCQASGRSETLRMQPFGRFGMPFISGVPQEPSLGIRSRCSTAGGLREAGIGRLPYCRELQAASAIALEPDGRPSTSPARGARAASAGGRAR